MKKATLSLFAFLALAAAVSSCNKSSSNNNTTTNNNNNNNTTTTSSNAPTVNAGDVDGALVSLKTDISTTSAGYTVNVSTESGLAAFYTTRGNSGALTEAGTVSVNDFNLEKQTGNSYLKVATIGQTPADLKFSTNDSKWVVGGATGVPSFTYTHNVPFPSYSGTLPESITRSGGVTVTLGSSVSDADSVIVMIAKGSTTILHTYAPSTASVTISASELSALAVTTDKSAIMEVVPYRITLNTQGSKKYAFIKEYALVRNININ